MNECVGGGGAGGLLHHVRSHTVVRSHGNSLSWGLGLGMGMLGPPLHPHVPRGLSLTTPLLTVSQCFLLVLNLKVLLFLILAWLLRIKGLALRF